MCWMNYLINYRKWKYPKTLRMTVKKDSWRRLILTRPSKYQISKMINFHQKGDLQDYMATHGPYIRPSDHQVKAQDYKKLMFIIEKQGGFWVHRYWIEQIWLIKSMRSTWIWSISSGISTKNRHHVTPDIIKRIHKNIT